MVLEVMRRSALDRDVVPVLRQAFKANMTQQTSTTRDSVYELGPQDEIDSGMPSDQQNLVNAQKLSSSSQVIETQSKVTPGISSLFNGK